MTINDLEFYLVEIPCTEQDEPVRSVLVRLTTDSGLDGWGEARLRWQPEGLSGRRDALLSVLAGRSIFDIEEMLMLQSLADAPLRSAVEMACWDLVGRAVGEPLCRLFGGGYRMRIPLAVRLPEYNAQRIANVARELAEQGFHTQIITSCGRPEQDLQTLSAVRQGVGERAELRLDAAAGYDLQIARDLCAELEHDDLQFLLDPLSTSEFHAVASLGRQTSVPLAVCRAIRSPGDVLMLARYGAAPFVVIDLWRIGGMSAARKCAAVAQAGGIAALPAAVPSVGIATAAMLQLAAATPAFSACNECAHHQLHDDVLVEPLEIADGMMAVPQSPGLGIEVDRSKVERYQVA